MRHSFLAAHLLVALSLAGCATVDPNALTPVDLAMTDLPPTPQVIKAAAQGRPRLAVVPRLGKDKRLHGLTELAAEQVEQKMLASRFNVLDRAAVGNTKLADEVLAAEDRGSGALRESATAAAADQAIVVTVSEALVRNEFSAATQGKGLDGKPTTIPAQCRYNAKANVRLRAYLLPSMEPITTSELDGSVARSVEAASRNCTNAGLADELSREVIRKAVDDRISGFMNTMAPVGYVLERRDETPGAKAFYRTSLGAPLGAKTGLKVKIKRKEIAHNQLTQEDETRWITITEADITQFVDAQGSWVQVSGAEAIERIKLGDVVELVFGCDEGERAIFGKCFKL